MSGAFDLLLVGAGHTHLGVLRQWAVQAQRQPWRIALVSPDPHAWYSGMLPGMVAEDYRPEQCRIALAPLCEAAGVEFLPGRVDALQADEGRLLLADGCRLQGRWLSLNPGSLPRLPTVHDSRLELLPVKPFAGFVARWQFWQRQPLPLAIIGGGAAGVELAMAMARRVPPLTLFSGGELLKGHPPALRRRALGHLRAYGVRVREHCRIDEVRDGSLRAAGQAVWRGRRAIVATGAGPLPWLVRSGLERGAGDFVRIAPSLQSVSHPQVFAVGDCASLPDTPHNGVQAVRQAPVLAGNLLQALQDRPLEEHYRPQRTTLALMLDGEGSALMSWAGLTAEGRLLRLWKDHLDQRFVARHRRAGEG